MMRSHEQAILFGVLLVFVGTVLAVGGLIGLPDTRPWHVLTGIDGAILGAVIAESFEDVSELVGAPRIGQDDWTIALVAQLYIWKSSYQEALALDPPEAFAVVHDPFLEAMSLYDGSADDIVYALDNFDADRLATALDKMNRANLLILEANRLINDLTENR